MRAVCEYATYIDGAKIALKIFPWSPMHRWPRAKFRVSRYMSSEYFSQQRDV